MICQFNGTNCRHIECPLWTERLQACRFVLAVDKILGDDGKRLMPLTPREQAVLDLMVQGYGNQKISDALSINYQATKNHVSSILAKLGAKNRTEAVILTLRKKLE